MNAIWFVLLKALKMTFKKLNTQMSLQYYSAFFYLQTKKVHKKKIFTMTLKVNMKL